MNGRLLGLAAFLLVATSMGLWFWRMQRVEIPKDRRGFVASWLVGAALGIVALTQDPGWLGGVPAVVAVVAGLFFSALVFVSPQQVAADAIRVGERLRDFVEIGRASCRERVLRLV